MPTGLIDNPHVTPKRAASDIANLDCARESQIGLAIININAEKPGS